MKKYILSCLFLSLFFLSAGFAQIEIEFEDQPTPQTPTPAPEQPRPEIRLDESMSLDNRASVTEEDESMAKGIQPALVLVLEVNDRKLTEKEWKNFMKDYGGKTKRAKGGNGENLTAGAEIVGINGINALDVYSKAMDGESGNTELLVWFDLGGDFLDATNRASYSEAEKMLLKFAHQVKVEHTRNELKASEKELKNLKGNLSRLEKQNSNYHREIEEAKKRIAQAEENIIKNEEQQGDAAQKIELQKMLVEEIDRRLEDLRKQ